MPATLPYRSRIQAWSRSQEEDWGDVADLEDDETEDVEEMREKKYTSFNWATYGISAVGTFLILWWST